LKGQNSNFNGGNSFVALFLINKNFSLSRSIFERYFSKSVFCFENITSKIL
jgi:hypothetical protein